MRRIRGSKLERFRHNVIMEGGGCWVWLGFCNDAGYGILRTGTAPNSRMERAHRLSWEFHNGPVPAGLQVLHHCDNPPCVRPSHLWLGTPSDNMSDKAAKGRSFYHPGRDLRRMVPRGEGMGRAAKLTTAQVREIRAKAPTCTHAALGREYGVSQSQIGEIVARRSWTHVE